MDIIRVNKLRNKRINSLSDTIDAGQDDQNKLRILT